MQAPLSSTAGAGRSGESSRLQRERQILATGKVRIFELAKEVGLTSKELITLFNERLGGIFEAKNQLSVVPDHIADLVRSVLLKTPAAKPKPAEPKEPPAVKPSAVKAAAAPKAASPKTEAPASPAEPIPTLKPVAPSSRRTAAAKPPAAAPKVQPPEPARPIEMPAVEPALEPGAAEPAAAAPAVQLPPAAARPATPQAPQQPLQRLRPVPAGQQSILPARRQAPPPTTSASASPGPQTGLPGRPGVAPRPGQAGGPPPLRQDGQAAGQPRVPQPGRLIQPAPQRRPQGNGPFRPLTPPGQRPFTPRPGGLPPSAADAPAPSSGAGGGRPGAHGRDRDDKINKKDREKELLLEKERSRKKRTESAPQAPTAKLEAIEIPDLLTVQELATSMIVPAKDVIKELIKIGTMATINQNIPSDVSYLGCEEVRFQCGRQRGRRGSNRRARGRQARDDERAAPGRDGTRTRRSR